MSDDDIEVLATVMSYLHSRGFTKTQIKNAVDAWWKVKKETL
jgi:SOS response regulatory protein OraA/RecX